MSVEDQEVLKWMENSVREVDGHYEVGILWKSVISWLPSNKQMAEARLQSLKGKLQRDETFHISIDSLWRTSLTAATPQS